MLASSRLQGRDGPASNILHSAVSSVTISACLSLRPLSVQFYEVDLPPVSEKKIKLVNAVIPDEKKVSACAIRTA